MNKEENEYFNITDVEYDSSATIYEILERRRKFAEERGKSNYIEYSCENYRKVIEMLIKIRDNLQEGSGSIEISSKEEAFKILREELKNNFDIDFDYVDIISPWDVDVERYKITNGKKEGYILYDLHDNDWKLPTPCTLLIDKTQSCVSMRVKKWDSKNLINLFHETGHAIKNINDDYHPNN